MKNSHRIKIFYCITGLQIGGAEKFLFTLLKSLDRSRFDPTVVTIVEEGVFADKIRLLGIRVVCLNKSSKLGLGIMIRLYRMMRRDKPQIVHTHLFGGDMWGRIPAILARVPIRLSTEHNTNYDEGFIKQWIKRLLARMTHQIICVSESVKSYVINRDRIPARKLKVIFNPVDPELYQSIPLKPHGDHTIGIIARMEERKGHAILFKALAILKKKYSDIKCLVVYAGGYKNWEDQMHRLVRQLNISDQVIWVKNQHEIESLIEKMTLVVAPSSYEGFGISSIEAMASGRPVIAFDVEGLREIVQHMRNGLLTPDQTPEALVKAIDRLFEDKNLYQSLQINARKHVMNKFSVQLIGPQYERVYDHWITMDNKKL